MTGASFELKAHSGRPLDYKEEKKYNYKEQYWQAFSEV
jgi:hypothetical protein